MSRKIIWILLWLTYIASIAVYWLNIGGQNAVALRNTVYLVLPFLATVAGVFLLVLYGFKEFRARTILALTVGIGLLFVGEVLFYVYQVILNSSPFPSLADVFYIASYPVILLGLVSELSKTPVDIKKIRTSIKFLLSIIVGVLTVVVIYAGIYAVYDPTKTLLSNSIAFGYGVGDLLLIVATMFVLVLAWEFRSGKFSAFWLFFFFGFFAELVADILYAVFVTAYVGEVWLYKSLIDSLFLLSYALFASGFLSFSFSILDARRGLRLHRPKKQL